jgi:hypothetical protein
MARLPGDGPTDDGQGKTAVSQMAKALKTPKLPRTSAVKKRARFWDTHDLTDFETELEEVTEPVFAHGTPIHIHLDPTDADSLRRIAAAKGISEAELIRDWVRQRLARQRPHRRKNTSRSRSA